jgi:methionine-rich copper-binding protein CopC
LHLHFTRDDSSRRFSGATLSTGAGTVDPQNRGEIVLKLPPLASGRCCVNWHAMSIDTHRTKDTIGFDVRGYQHLSLSASTHLDIRRKVAGDSI